MDTFDVYKVETVTDAEGRSRDERYYMGTTKAVSEAKAISNVRYRTQGKRRQLYGFDFGPDVSVIVSWEAVRVY